MNDTFMEKIVTRKKTGQDYLRIFGLLVAGFVIMLAITLFASYIMFLVPALLVGLVYGLWFMMSGMNREYEYIVTNGDLDIDMIIARRKRKRVFSCKPKDIELMAGMGSDEYKDAQKRNLKLIDCSMSLQAKDNWFIITDYKGQKVMAVFAPDERMLKSMKRFNPSKIKYTQYGA